MRQLTAIIAFLFSFVISVSAQQATVKGIIRDTSENKDLSNAVISIIKQSDSTMAAFARSKENGSFEIKHIVPGKYLLMVTYPKFADYVEELNIEGSETKDLGTVMITPQTKLLEAVIVRQNIAIRMKGDTIEYKADSFKVQQGANVQDLLKKLPGIQVDRNGQITAQGQKVEKVLVDGEEFFSDDPAVVTQNLRADAIDKVQSYDKKSDQAEFTGVDDGSRTKTLNLVLKDDKKKGYFGKITAGGGTDERYSNEAMLNFFKGKKKFSAYGIMSNTGKIGLDWQDRDKFGSGNDWGDADIEVGAGFIMISGNGSDEEFSDYGSDFWGEGVPQSWKAGAHFSNKWNRDFSHINTNYVVKGIRNDFKGNSLTKYIIRDSLTNRDSSYYSSENHHKAATEMQQLFTGMYEIKLDSMSSLKFRLNGALSHSDNAQFTQSGVDDGNLQAVNRNTRNNTNKTDKQAFLASVLYKQKFKKTGRTFSISASHKYTDNQNTGYLFSETDYYNRQGQLYARDSIDQYKESYGRNLTSSAKMVYTEPLSKKSVLEFNYGFNRNANSSDRKSFDKTNGKYTELNSVFSNSYELLYLANSAGLKYQYNSKKLTANIGSNVGLSNYVQKDSLGRETRHYRYTNLFPNARINYRLGAQKGITLSYNGRTEPPTIDQVQPILENTDPLNITIGNPNLTQAFEQNFTLFYNDFKVLTGRNIWGNVSYNFTQDAIVVNQATDSSGKRTSQYVNTNGNYGVWWYLSYGIKLKKIDLYISARTNGNLNRYNSYVNNLQNANTNKSVNFGLNFNKDKQDKYSIYANADYAINRSLSSISSVVTKYWTQSYGIGSNIYFSKRLSIENNLDADLRQKLDAFDKNNNVLTWNASLIYKMFKNKNGQFKFSAFDILDQRKGFSRSFNSNYITEKNYEVLRRYFLLSYTWNFTKNPGTTK